jgi:transposase-like protein
MSANPIRADEQYRLIMECRSSGLTDHEWCLQHDIKPGTFYNWVKRLRKKGCHEIPVSARHSAPCRQEVVKVELPSHINGPASPRLTFQDTNLYPAAEPVMELSVAGAILRIPNGTDPAMLRQTLLVLKELSC